eukprot:COSAG02_NODE_12979_length_1465_cov_1.476574_4_plen_23_part_01
MYVVIGICVDAEGTEITHSVESR